MGSAGSRGAAILLLIVVAGCGRFGFSEGDETISGMVSGLAGTVVLQNTGGDTIELSANGSFAFETRFAIGAPYEVTVLAQPDSPSQTCVVSGGSGQVTDAGTTIMVTCATTYSMVSAGGLHTCALRPDGTLWCWGGNSSGELGDGTTNTAGAPIQVGSERTWATVAAGQSHTCALRANGTLWC